MFNKKRQSRVRLRLATPLLTLVVLAGLLAGLNTPSKAADLQAGWYVELYAGEVYNYYQGVPNLAYSGYFVNPPLGQVGVFQIDNRTYHDPSYLHIFISQNVTNIGVDQTLTFNTTFGIGIGTHIGYFVPICSTNYDATQMHVELWRKRTGGNSELVWTQDKSGPQVCTPQLLNNTNYEGSYYYKVIVPEPQTCLTLAVCLLGLAPIARRSRKV